MNAKPYPMGIVGKKKPEENSEQKRNSSAERKPSAAAPIKSDPSTKTEVSVTPASGPPAVKSATRNEPETKEEKAKRRKRRFHEAMTWLTAGLLVVGTATAWAMYRSIQQVDTSIRTAKEANDLTKTAFQLTQRPWIGVTIGISGPLDYRETGEVGLPVRIAMKNTGQMPALFAKPHIEMNPLGGERGDPIKEQNRLCGELRDDPLGGDPLSYAIFPGQTIAIDETLGIHKELVEKAFPNSTNFSPYIVGCIDYTTVTRDRHNQTGFVYFINQTEPGHFGTFGFDKKSEDIPADRLIIFPWGGSYAD